MLLGTQTINFTRNSSKIDDANKNAEDAKNDAQKAIDMAESQNGRHLFLDQQPPHEKPGVDFKDGDLWYQEDSDHNVIDMFTFEDNTWKNYTWDAQTFHVKELASLSANLGQVTAGNLAAVSIDGSSIHTKTFDDPTWATDIQGTEEYWIDKNGIHESWSESGASETSNVWITQGEISWLKGAGRPWNHPATRYYISYDKADLPDTKVNGDFGVSHDTQIAHNLTVNNNIKVTSGFLDVNYSSSYDYTALSMNTDGSLRLQSLPVYNRTYSSAANVHVTQYGVLGRSTSATKYKYAISELPNSETLGDSLLTLKPKRWYDKAIVEDVVNEMNTGHQSDDHGIPLGYNVGLIAEDLRDAGLEDFIQYGAEGVIEGIQYDRLFILLLPIIQNLRNEVLDLKTEKIKGDLK